MRQKNLFYALPGVHQMRSFGFLTLALIALLGCSPTVKVEAPDEPIEINLNIKIEQDIRIRLDKDVEELITENSDIF